MKKHMVSILYQTSVGNFIFTGLVNEVIGDNGKAIVYPQGVFRKAFKFKLPVHSTISIL